MKTYFKALAAAAIVFGMQPAAPAFAQDGAETSSTRPVESLLTQAAGFGGLQSQSASQWQGEYNEALRRKSSGKKKMLLGAGLSVGGALIAGMAGASCGADDVFSGDGCQGELNLAWLGYLTSVAGGGVLVWGGLEYFDANGDLNRLELRRARPSASFPISDRVNLQVSVGRRTGVGLRTSW